MVNREKHSDRHSRGKDYTIWVAISCAIVLFAIIFVFIARGSEDGDAPDASDMTAASSDTTDADTPDGDTAESDTVTDALPETTAAPETSTTVHNKPVTTAPPVTQVPPEPVTSDEVTYYIPAPGEYTGVPYSGPADLSAISNAVFIGDSRTEGLRLYTSILASGARVYANKGLSVSSVYTNSFVRTDAGNVTALDAMRAAPDYDSVYICLGINELGWQYIEVYTEKYAALVETIREINPSADIYIQGLLPVTEQRSASDEIFNNSRIGWFNANLLALAESLGVHYLNVSEIFGGNGGALPPDASTDGIHLNKTYCVQWLDYILEHRA